MSSSTSTAKKHLFVVFRNNAGDVQRFNPSCLPHINDTGKWSKYTNWCFNVFKVHDAIRRLLVESRADSKTRTRPPSNPNTTPVKERNSRVHTRRDSGMCWICMKTDILCGPPPSCPWYWCALLRLTSLLLLVCFSLYRFIERSISFFDFSSRCFSSSAILTKHCSVKFLSYPLYF